MRDEHSMKITFFPVAEQYALASQETHKRKGIRQSKWANFVSYYCIIHVFLVPAILVYFDRYLFAAIAFGLTLLFVFAVPRVISKDETVDFYKQWFALDPETIEVELTEYGIHTSCEDCSTSHKWQSVNETRETDDAVYFFTKDCGIAIPKTAFESVEHQSAFIDFARSKQTGA